MLNVEIDLSQTSSTCLILHLNKINLSDEIPYGTLWKVLQIDSPTSYAKSLALILFGGHFEMVSYFQVIMMAQINTSYSKSLVCGSQQCAAVFDVMWHIFLL